MNANRALLKHRRPFWMLRQSLVVKADQKKSAE
jgi:hypothetical protein